MSEPGEAVVVVGRRGQLEQVRHAGHVGTAHLGQRGGHPQVGGGVDDVGDPPNGPLPVNRVQAQPWLPHVAGDGPDPAAGDLGGQLGPVPPGTGQPAGGRLRVRRPNQRHHLVVGLGYQAAGDLGAEEPGGPGEQDYAAHAGSPHPCRSANPRRSSRLRRAAVAWAS